MNIFKILFGLSALMLAWGLLFRTGMIFKINSWMRENIFNDEFVLFSRRRLAVLLILLGGVALFSGIENIADFQSVKLDIDEKVIEQAKSEFRLHHYPRVINRCKQLVRRNTNNLEAWELMAASYWATGQKDHARNCLKEIIRIKPDHPLRKWRFEKFIEVKEKETQ